MRRAEAVVFAFGALGEPRQPAALAQRPDTVAPAGQDLVRIGLMADVPDQPVVRRVEHVVQRDGQLDHAEAGAEMPAGHRHRADRLGAQFVGNLPAGRFRSRGADRPGILIVSRIVVLSVMFGTTSSLGTSTGTGTT